VRPDQLVIRAKLGRRATEDRQELPVLRDSADLLGGKDQPVFLELQVDYEVEINHACLAVSLL